MFRKSNLLFALAFLSGTATAQDSESIASIFSNQGLTLDVVSTSQDQSTFAGISKETSFLILAQKKTGNYKLPEKIDSSLTEGAFRPEGYSENEYLFFSVYDASSLYSPFRLAPITTNHRRFLIINTRNPNHSRALVETFSYPDRFSSRLTYSRKDKSLQRNKNYASQTFNNDFGLYSVLPSNDQIWMFATEKIIDCFTENVTEFVRLNLDGTIASKTEIELKEPIFWSNKGRGVVKDEVTNEYYIFTETNFSYNWYSLNSETGVTKFIAKMNDVWKNPNFRIEEGQLHYQKMKAEKSENHTLDLKN